MTQRWSGTALGRQRYTAVTVTNPSSARTGTVRRPRSTSRTPAPQAASAATTLTQPAYHVSQNNECSK